MLRDFQIIGRIGKIDEIQLRKQGSRGCEVRIACSDFKDGEEITSWFSVTCFGNCAANVLDMYKTGDQIFASGSIDMDKWVDKQSGKERTRMKLKAFRTRRLAKGKASREEGGSQHSAPQAPQQPQQEPQGGGYGGYAQQFDSNQRYGGEF